MPVTHFKLTFGITYHVPLNTIANSLWSLLSVEFLEKNGNQVRHMFVHEMTLPMTAPEFNFYSCLPNLKSLEVFESSCRRVSDG